MAQVFSNDMVAHVWAQGRQDSGRSHNGQFYFEGPALYSYGSHFVAGWRMPDGAALISSWMSTVLPTTSRHVSRAHSAARGAAYVVPKLTALANSYALKWLASDDAETRKRGRAAVVAHVTENALSFGDDAAEYLLRQAGRPRAWPSIRAKAEAGARKAKAKAAAREIASRKGEAARMAAMSERDFAALVAHHEAAEPWGKFASESSWRSTEWRKARPSEALGQFATELHRMGVTARAHLGKRAIATLKARLATVRARVKRLARYEANGAALAHYSRALSALRPLYRERMGHGPLSREENKRLARLAHVVATTRPGLLTAKARESLALTIANCEALERDAAEREARARLERERADREAWLAGGGTRWTRFSDAQGGAYVRAVDVTRDDAGRIVGGTLETSHGADVPLPHALKAFAFVRRVVATGQAWHANGHCIRVGHFRVDSIDTAGTMRAGCHTIHLAEMERLAAALGVADMAASDDALESSRGAA